VRPIITLGGEHEVNEVWLEDVRVPVENRVYEENKGWTCAKFLLAHERVGHRRRRQFQARGIERIKDIARSEAGWRHPAARQPVLQAQGGRTADRPDRARIHRTAQLAGEAAGQGPGPESSSLLKIKGSEIQQRMTELALEAVGHYGAPYFRGFGEGDNEHPIGPDYGPPHRAELFQHAQDHDLRRIQRDPAQHHRQDGSGIGGDPVGYPDFPNHGFPLSREDLTKMDFTYNETQDMLRDTLARFLADTYDFETRQKMLAAPMGRDPGIWNALATELGLTWAPPLPRSMAAWAAAP
jgi:hypothetical protein